jgi:threonyl-tRNA synthetase
VPYTIVVGERELEGQPLTVRTRFGETLELTLADFVARVSEETRGKPDMPTNLPVALSKRPIFAG